MLVIILALAFHQEYQVQEIQPKADRKQVQPLKSILDIE